MKEFSILGHPYLYLYRPIALHDGLPSEGFCEQSAEPPRVPVDQICLQLASDRPTMQFARFSTARVLEYY